MTSRACSTSFPKGTRLRCLAILHRLCVTVPAANIAIGRVLPEVLVVHLESDGECMPFVLRFFFLWWWVLLIVCALSFGCSVGGYGAEGALWLVHVLHEIQKGNEIEDVTWMLL